MSEYRQEINDGYDRFRRSEMGKDEFFGLLDRRMRSPLLNFCYRFLGSTDEAEDVVSEAIFKAYEKTGSYSPRARNGGVSNFSTWIYTIAANLCKSELRRRKRWRMFSISDSSEDEGLHVFLDDGRSAEASAEAGEIARDTKTALDKLPEHYSDALLMRFAEGMSYHDMAEMLGVPLGTAKSRVYRARNAFTVVYGTKNGRKPAAPGPKRKAAQGQDLADRPSAPFSYSPMER